MTDTTERTTEHLPPADLRPERLKAAQKDALLAHLGQLEVLRILGDSNNATDLTLWGFTPENLAAFGNAHKLFHDHGRQALGILVDAGHQEAYFLGFMLDKLTPRPEAELALWLVFEATPEAREEYIDAIGMTDPISYIPEVASFLIEHKVKPIMAAHGGLHAVIYDLQPEVVRYCTDLADGFYDTK
jgi:hypothetical protein